jgi:DNA-binding NarL/FixJ family response regulator
MLRAAGFDGYVLKSDAARDLLRGVREVLAGGKFYDEEKLQSSASA